MDTDCRPDLRLQLLEPERYPFLYKCLYGLLMLLPQSSAFAALKNRLNSVSAIGYLHTANYSATAGGAGGASRTYVSSQVSNYHQRQKSLGSGDHGGPSSLLSPLSTIFPQAHSSTTSPVSPHLPGGTQAHTSSGVDRQTGSASTSSVVSNFERPNRLKAREDSNVRWVELLEKFRTTQEKARKQSRGQLGGGEDGDSPPPVPDKEQGIAVADQARGGVPQRVIPRAGTPTGGPLAGQPAPAQKPPAKTKVGLGFGKFGGGGSKKDKKK